MTTAIYPKATAPLTWPVLAAANARAERWRLRLEEARAEVARLRAEVESLGGAA